MAIIGAFLVATKPLASCDPGKAASLMGFGTCLSRADAAQMLEERDRTVDTVEEPVCFDDGRYAGTSGFLEIDMTSETTFVFERTRTGWEALSWGSHGGFCLELVDAGVSIDQLADAVPFTSYCKQVEAER